MSSEPALALHLLRQTRRHGALIAVLRGAGRLDRVGRLAEILAEGVEVAILPPLDVLPYDLIPPSAEVIGQRVRALTDLAKPATLPRLLLTTATSALQLVRPPEVWREAELILRPGDRLDRDSFRTALALRAYHWDERVDEPGEAALRGQVIDVFPAGERSPARIQLREGRIDRLTDFDPATLRSGAPLEQVVLRPATEYRIDVADEALLRPEGERRRAAGALPRRLQPIFASFPDAAIYRDPEIPDRLRSVRDAIDDAYDAARKVGRLTGGGGELPRPEALFMSAEAVIAACAEPIAADRTKTEPVEAPRRIDDLLAMAKGHATGRVVIAAAAMPERVAASLRKRGLDVQAGAGRVCVVQADIAVGMRHKDLLLIPVGNLLRPKASTSLAPGDDPPRIGDTVVHLDHGIATLDGLRPHGDEDRVALAFAGDVELLIPPAELGRVWRYGGDGGHLDRITGTAWTRKRAEIEKDLQSTAAQLVARAAARRATAAPILAVPPAAAQVARRFLHPLSPDQRAAIHASAADLARGYPMARLLCGDVGFGKTEVAIRTAAACAFSGWQVAIAAPTTILARQHLEEFRGRFEDTGIRVEGAIRTTGRDVRDAVAAGEVGIVIGTQAVAGLAFAKAGLVIVDEEQRFGEADKAALQALAPHALSMSATPIPRTMQAALVGLLDVSVLATPPQSRQPTRTYVVPWDGLVVREALLRERRRGGQSFVVCPRIADLERVRGELAELVPDLSLVVAHGRLPAEALDAAVLDFAAGRGDVLLATDIIESGLDIPRANLMIVTNADRFGLSQLHQLRGRVGRGTRRGVAYFTTEADRRLSEPTRRRLTTLETFAALGAGVDISTADLESRGAGDLFGDRQAGHVRAVGTELYQHLLLRAVEREGDEPPQPRLELGLTGRLPADYVPEESLRIALLRRLARVDDLPSLLHFEEEIADRFGEMPPEAAALVLVQRLRVLCRIRGIGHVEAGERGVAMSEVLDAQGFAASIGGTVRRGRVMLDICEPTPLARADRLRAILEAA